MAHIGAAGIVNKLVDAVAREIGMAWGVKDEWKKLQNTLEMILPKIVDAEQKQDKDNELRLWLKTLKNIAYDADDIIDSFSYEAMRRQHERDGVKNKVLEYVSSSNPLAFRLGMAKKLRVINKRLDVAANDMGRFQLQTTHGNTAAAQDDSSEKLHRQTMSLVDESDTFEREDDKNEIVKMLTSNPNQNCEKVAVISVVGIGGLGKTKLAQLVYNDKLVKKHFDLRIWVCITEDFDFKALLIKLLACISQNMEVNNISNVDLLAKKAREELTEKKYLLVLDDLWNEDAERWERLKSLLAVGAQGSKVLITTRKIQVADVIKGSIPPYKLTQLEEDECWSIISKKAFSHGGALKTSNMTNIGREIAKRCGGLPLAAKFLGSLMYSKSEESDWLSIQGNDIWSSQGSQNKVIPILRLSYANLSSQLKQCFTYCSLFPKNCEINKETLIQLWMAEGYLDPFVAPNRSIENAGNECFEGLLGSSFLEGVKKNVLGDITTCKMHDLVHDLAQALVGDGECVSLKVSELNNVSEVRRLELNFLEELLILDVQNVKDPVHAERANLQRKRNLGSLQLWYGERWMLEETCCSDAISMVLEALQPPTNLRNLKIVNFMGLGIPRWMRVPSNLPSLEQLELVNCKEIKQLPAAIGQFPRLRFFELTGMSLKSLDIGFPFLNEINLTDMLHLEEMCCSCPSLQNMKIVGCKSLIEFPSFPSLQQLSLERISHELVSSIGYSLTSLTKLLLENVEELVCFPMSIIHNNRNLQVLSFNGCKHFEGFRVGYSEDEVATFGSLQRLVLMDCPVLKLAPDLRRWHSLWKLSIFRCPLLRVALTYDLKSLSFLKELYVDFIQQKEQHGNISDADDLINLLQ